MRVYGKWKVTLPDEEYVYDPDNWPLRLYRQLEADTGLTVKTFNQALGARQADACQWLVWCLRHEAGRVEDLTSVDFPLLQMGLVEIPDEGEAEAADTPPSETAT